MRDGPATHLVIAIAFRSIRRDKDTFRFVLLICQLRRDSEFRADLIGDGFLYGRTTVSYEACDGHFGDAVLFRFRYFHVRLKDDKEFHSVRDMVSEAVVGDERDGVRHAVFQVEDGCDVCVGSVLNVVVFVGVVGVCRLERALRRAFVIFLFQRNPLGFERDDRAKWFRVFCLAMNEGMFDPWINLCTGSMFLLFQDRVDQRQLVIVCHFGKCVSAGDLEFVDGVLNLMVIRVRVDVEDRGCVVFLFYNFGASNGAAP